MAGFEGYERVYRGRPMESWEGGGTDFPSKYHGREVIHPLEIPVTHPLAEDSPPSDDGNVTILLSNTKNYPFRIGNTHSDTCTRYTYYSFFHRYFDGIN